MTGLKCHDKTYCHDIRHDNMDLSLLFETPVFLEIPYLLHIKQVGTTHAYNNYLFR